MTYRIFLGEISLPVVSRLPPRAASLILIYPDHDTPLLIHVLLPVLDHHPLILQRVDHGVAQLVASISRLDLVTHE